MLYDPTQELKFLKFEDNGDKKRVYKVTNRGWFSIHIPKTNDLFQFNGKYATARYVTSDNRGALTRME